MAVTIIYASSSNKAATVGISLHKSVVPTCSLKLDKLSLVVHVESQAVKDEIKKSLMASAKDSEDFENAHVAGYKVSLFVKLAPNAKILICAGPSKASAPEVRLEWNPSKAGSEGHALFATILPTILPWDYAELVEQARVTRTDVALDLAGVNINDLHFLPASPRLSHIYYGHKGETQTLYLGGHKSKRCWRIYDKAAHLKHVGCEPLSEITRLERVIRGTRPFTKLPKLANPFADIKVLDLRQKGVVPLMAPTAWRHFQDSCRYRGLNAVLAQMGKAERQKYRNALQPFKSTWWNASSYWDQWPKTLVGTGLLVPNAVAASK